MDKCLVCVGHAPGRSRLAHWWVLRGVRKTLSQIFLGAVPFVWSVILLIAPTGLSIAGEKFEFCGKNVLCRTLGAGDEKTSGQGKAGNPSAVTPGGNKKNNKGKKKGAATDLAAELFYVYANGKVCDGIYEGARYKGECGTGKWYSKVKVTMDSATYQGMVRSAHFEGFGTIRFDSGALYVGQFKADRYHGKGTYTWADKREYKGQFRKGKRHGQGRFQWADGAVYEGAWRQEEIQGNGKLTSPDGSVYVGGFKNGIFSGRGSFAWPNGNSHKGQYRQGKIQGSGTYIYRDKGKLVGKYVGNFVDGQRTGRGTFTWADGTSLEGVFKAGKPWSGIRKNSVGKRVATYKAGKEYLK
ncbi:MAG TPA: hypothetical protein EYG12_01335 [Gammaproteobacteria bacterium]|nr:hypothetical protein [Gammaproteobacteria bacterium]